MILICILVVEFKKNKKIFFILTSAFFEKPSNHPMDLVFCLHIFYKYLIISYNEK